jgi:hypothetical protein
MELLYASVEKVSYEVLLMSVISIRIEVWESTDTRSDRFLKPAFLSFFGGKVGW